MIMSLKLYENYLLMIRDNLIRCGVGLPVKDDYTYEELFNLSEEIDQILWYYRVLAIANSRDRLKDFIFPMDRTYVSYMRNVFYKEYCESKKDRREVTISGLVPNTDIGHEYRDTDEDEEELFEKSFDEEENDTNGSDRGNRVNSSTDHDLTNEDLDEIWGNDDIWGNDEDDSESDSSENESKSSVNTDKSDIEHKDSDLKELQDSVIYVTMDMLEIDEKGFYVYSTEDDEDAEDEDPFGDDSNDTLWGDDDEDSGSVEDMDDSEDDFPDRDSDEEDEDNGSDIPNEEDEDDIFSGLGDDEPDEDVNTFENVDDEDNDEDVDFPDNDDIEDDEDDIPDNEDDEDDEVDFPEDENGVDDEDKDEDEDDLFSAWGDEDESNEDEDDFPSNDVDNEDDDFPDLSDEDEDIPEEDVDDEDDFPDLDSEDEEDSDDAEDFPDWNDKDNQDNDDDIDFSDWDEDQDDEDEEKVKHSVNKNKGSIKGDKPTPSKKDGVGSKGNKSNEGVQDSFEHTRDEQFVESFDKVINDTLNFGRKSGKKIINKIWKGMTNQE